MAALVSVSWSTRPERRIHFRRNRHQRVRSVGLCKRVQPSQGRSDETNAGCVSSRATSIKPVDAQRPYEHVLAIDPYAVVAANNLAWMYVERNQSLDVAMDLAQRAKQALPSDPRVNDTLGWVLFQRNLTDKAIPLLVESVKGDTGNPLHAYHLGMAYVRSGDWAKGRPALERALKLDDTFPGAAQARNALAMIGESQ